MDENAVQDLLDFLVSSSDQPKIFETKLEQCSSTVEWAKKLRKWDLLIELTSILSYYFAYTGPALDLAEIDQERALKERKKFWQRGKVFAAQGLIAARQAGNRNAETQFLAYLVRLATLLEDYNAAQGYVKELIHLRTSDGPETKSALAYELARLGQQAAHSGHYTTSSAYFQMSLSIFQELGDRRAMADVLVFLGRSDLKQGNLTVAKQFFENSIEHGRQSDHLSSVVASLQGLGEVLLLEGETEQARASFRKALSIIDELESPSDRVMREELQEILASLNS